jgi:hypothetical protein
VPAGIDVVVEGDMPSGQWQIRDKDGVIVHGASWGCCDRAGRPG